MSTGTPAAGRQSGVRIGRECGRRDQRDAEQPQQSHGESPAHDRMVHPAGICVKNPLRECSPYCNVLVIKM